MNPLWTIDYDNDTGPDDDGYSEWWTVSNGLTAFRCYTHESANWLRDTLNALRK